MSDPTPAVRAVTYERDGHRCVSCGTIHGLQYQHRAAEGMGGYAPRPQLEEGLASCGRCNTDYEGPLQGRALKSGWKVRRWVRDRGLTHLVPVLYAWEGTWYRLTRDGLRIPITQHAALVMMREVYGDEWDEMEKAA